MTTTTVRPGELVRVKCQLLDKTQYREAKFVEDMGEGSVKVTFKGDGLAAYYVKAEQVFVHGKRYGEEPVKVTVGKIGDIVRKVDMPLGTPRQLTTWIVNAVIKPEEVPDKSLERPIYQLVNIAANVVCITDFINGEWVYGS